MSSKLLSKTLIQNLNATFTRFYYTNNRSRSTLYTKISPLGHPGITVVPELENWVKDGKKVRVGELQRIIRDLRKRNRFSQALEVSEWMSKKEICIFSPVEHAVQLDLIGRVRGFDSAESYFNCLPDQDKNEKVYGALLICYVRQRQTEKSLLHWERMKELGFASSALVYNDIMCLYTNVGELDKVPDVLSEMKKNNVAPDNYSYRICMNSYGARGDLAGMEKVLSEMESREGIVMEWSTYALVANLYAKAGVTDKAISALKKSEEKLENKDGTGHNHLISIYATLGNKAEVLRLWDLEKSSCKRRINRDYINMLSSLLRLGELEELKKIVKEWELSGNVFDVRIPNMVISGYCEKGLYDEAKALLEDLKEKGKATEPRIWGAVAKGYFDKGELAKAYDCMKTALSLRVENKGWKPSTELTTGILSWLGNEASAEDVEAFVNSLRTVPVSREMYHALLKANLRAGKDVDRLLKAMKNDKLDEDEETKKILSLARERC